MEDSKNLFLRLKYEDSRLYLHCIPEKYVERVCSLTPKLRDNVKSEDEDAGYGFFLLTQKEKDKVTEIKQEFASLYEHLAGEEFLLQVFKD